MRRNIYILFALWIFYPLYWIGNAGQAFAQNDSVAKAVLLLQNQNMSADARVKQALETIDRAITNSESTKNAYAWYVRGFVYKEWYKTFEPQNRKSKTRIDAVTYLKKSLELDTAKEYAADIKRTLKYLGSTFYNDAGAVLDPSNYTIAIEDYEKFKECMLLAEPNYNLKIREIEFKTVLADVYAKIFRNDVKNNLESFTKAEQTYKLVNVLDTNNWAGNYNLAMLYYNYGVDIINAMDVSSDIIVIENIQDQSKELFKKALPYALKAYSLNPKKREVLIALQGIYFSLYEFDKSDEFKAKVEILDKEK